MRDGLKVNAEDRAERWRRARPKYVEGKLWQTWHTETASLYNQILAYSLSVQIRMLSEAHDIYVLELAAAKPKYGAFIEMPGWVSAEDQVKAGFIAQRDAIDKLYENNKERAREALKVDNATMDDPNHTALTTLLAEIYGTYQKHRRY